MSEEPDFDKIRAKATNYCSRRELCKQDMRKKLFKWKTPEFMQEEIIDFLVDEKYIDERRFCSAYVNDKYKFNHWGRTKIHFMLLQLNIDEKYIYEAIRSRIDENEYELICRNEIKKKLLALKNEQDKTKKRIKVFQNLLSKGFESELIQQILRDEERNHEGKY